MLFTELGTINNLKEKIMPKFVVRDIESGEYLTALDTEEFYRIDLSEALPQNLYLSDFRFQDFPGSVDWTEELDQAFRFAAKDQAEFACAELYFDDLEGLQIMPLEEAPGYIAPTPMPRGAYADAIQARQDREVAYRNWRALRDC